ncbi:MAG: type II toxin-antitoxin system PemK/MazF family toxin [Ilumatobacteraceae bacterium]
MVVTIPQRGEIWWGESPAEKGRPYLVLTRDGATAVRSRIVVAPVTTRIRSHPAELSLGLAEGLVRDSVANFDEVFTIAKSLLTWRLGSLGGVRIQELCSVMRASIDC